MPALRNEGSLTIVRWSLLRRLVLSGTVALVGGAWFSASSWGAVTIGQNAASPSGCAGGTTFLQDGTGAATPAYTVPAGGGVITSWSTNPGASSSSQFAFKVLKKVDATHFTVVGSDVDRAITASMVNTFAVRIPVSGGETIGFWFLGGYSCVQTSTGDGADVLKFRGGGGFANPPPNTPLTTDSNATSDRANVSAVVEPDADRDGFGDETQDACLGLPGSVNGCPKADLALTKTASQGIDNALVVYTLVAKNNGPDPVPDAVVSDTLPAGAQVVSATGPGGSCTASGATLRCLVGSLASGATGTIAIVARLTAGRQTNTATISSATLALAATKTSGAGESDPANNSATATVTVGSPAIPESKPVVSDTKVSPSTFRLGSLLPTFTRKPPVGTTISFKLSEAAKTTLTFAQPTTGRKVGKRCVAVTRANRKKPKCTIPNVRGTLTFNAHAGTNRVRFQGRLSRSKKLKPGRYTLTITATDSAGNRSNAKATSFTIVARRA